MKLQTVIAALEALSPPHLAEDWDRVGLHVGDPSANVRKALLCIDLTEAVLDEAVRYGAQLIVAYHPPIFRPLARLTTSDAKQRLILRAARKGIAVYCPHTALDAAGAGVNDWLASGLGAGEVRVILPATGAAGRSFKVVTFVPQDALDAVRSAMCGAGAGRIGDYESCSFSTPGQGTFRGGDATSPAVGRAGKFQRVDELRLELLAPARCLADVVAALRAGHPYEEPAFDVYPLEPAPDSRVGQGRVLTLHKPVSMPTLVGRVKKHLGVKHLEVAAPPKKSGGGGPVKRIGLCAGAGGSLLADAGPIDVFLTGEMRHHDQLDALGRGVGLILAGHTQTERPYLPTYRNRLAKAVGQAVQWRISRADKPPMTVK